MNDREIFANALQRETDAARSAYLDEACAGDTEMRCRIEALLHEKDDLGSFLESPAPGLAETVESPPITERPGQTIGRYKLLEEIGEGGMGVVYMAEQREPVRRKVALKIIKPGMDTREVIARFEAERQALAMMDHPNIAKVLDGGTTGEGARDEGLGAREKGSGFGVQGSGAAETPENDHAPIPNPQSLIPLSSPLAPVGRPYFVMELVQGIPITEYCDQANLTTRQRLELFVLVCQAVQHAHQKGRPCWRFNGWGRFDRSLENWPRLRRRSSNL